MPKGYKVKNWKFLSKELGILGDGYNYTLSEKSLKTKPLSFLLWAVAYLIDNLKPSMVFEDVAFMLMISDMRYFEMHVIEKRTGWSRLKSDRVVQKLMNSGYLKREKPSFKKGVYENYVFNAEYKYYPTPKYAKLMTRLETEFEAIFKEKDISLGGASDFPNEVKGSPN